MANVPAAGAASRVVAARRAAAMARRGSTTGGAARDAAQGCKVATRGRAAQTGTVVSVKQLFAHSNTHGETAIIVTVAIDLHQAVERTYNVRIPRRTLLAISSSGVDARDLCLLRWRCHRRCCCHPPLVSCLLVRSPSFV